MHGPGTPRLASLRDYFFSKKNHEPMILHAFGVQVGSILQDCAACFVFGRVRARLPMAPRVRTLARFVGI